MTEEDLLKLKIRVEADDPAAMYTYACEMRDSSPEEAEKYIELAAQLGEPHAAEELGDKHLEKGNVEQAMRWFARGAKAGILDCSVKIAALRIHTDEHNSVRELEELAESGVRSACIALSEYYKSVGNRRQSAYWRSLAK